MWDIFIIIFWEGGVKALKIVYEGKKKTFSSNKISWQSSAARFFFWVKMNGNMHLTGFLQWRELNGKAQFWLGTAFFSKQAESSVEMKAIKMSYSYLGPRSSLGKAATAITFLMDAQLGVFVCVCVFPTLTSRWRHCSRRFSRIAFSVSPKYYKL